MLDGLEAVELKLSEVLEDNESKRIDSEYFKKEYVKNYHILTQLQYTKLKDCTSKIDVGFVGSMVSEYTDNGIDFLQTQNINEFFVQMNDCKQINQIFHDRLKKSQIHKEDILVARSGSFGKASIYLHDKVVNSSDIIIVRADNKKINPFFLTTFLNSSFGSMQLHRFASGGLQGHVNLTILEQLIIPICFSDDFQERIETFVKLAHQKLEESKKLYSEAEELLLEELELNDFTPSNECVAVKSFSGSFGMSGRLDAEYYQLKYDDIIGRIKSYQGGYKKLGAITTLKKSIEPGSEAYGDEGVQFLRVADLFKYELREPEIRLSEHLFDAEKLDELKPKKGEVLLSKDGSVGIAYAVREDTNFIPSGAIVRLQQITDILPDVLTLILNSQVIQLQAERDAGGSILQHWKPSEIDEVLVPILDEKMQKIIAEKISESFSLRAESKKLLEEAKKEVELAIEQGE